MDIVDDLRRLKVVNKRLVWKPLMEKYGFRRICEVGVQLGINFRGLIEHGPELAVAVDIWRDDGVASRNDSGFSQAELDRQYEAFNSFAFNHPCVKIYRMYSQEAAEQFSDNFFDFVYIDADHTEVGCLADLVSWYPKVRPGGVLAGDDYRKAVVRTGVEFGVMQAVQSYAETYGLKFYELPRFNWAIPKPRQN